MFGLKRLLLADEQSFVPRSLTSADGACGHTGSSAIPPSASLLRERITLCRVNSLAPTKVFATGRFWRKADSDWPKFSGGRYRIIDKTSSANSTDGKPLRRGGSSGWFTKVRSGSACISRARRREPRRNRLDTFPNPVLTNWLVIQLGLEWCRDQTTGLE
jgi:hypothetical protein